ncbi:DUF6802 family protein [Rhodococcus sp. Q1]|uniref:DUF6802 family protein n=1 Tax=Rhodococcus TaxID=1827 RepID=UPI001020AA14|nr:DUF6802 family protein [Rhodococcus sp. Q1]
MAELAGGSGGPPHPFTDPFDPSVFDPSEVATWADALDPATDLDGDGVAETVVADSERWGDGGDRGDGLVVATDTDLDGSSDRLSVIADDGRYGVWEYCRELDGSGRWSRLDTGSLEYDVHHGEGSK